MDSKTMQRMRDHITESEGTLPNPYKDTNNKLTVGTGFLVDDEKSFIAMPFEIQDPKTRQIRLATEAEKKAEFKRTKKLSEAQLLDNATKSPLSLPESENQRRLDAEITTRIGKIKNEIGDADWDRLTDGQKTAVLDVHYANGSLEKFPKLKQAIKAGDAREMANQSDFHGGQIKGTDHQHRNFDRLRRNRAEMLGIDPKSDEAYREVADTYPDHPKLRDEYKKHRDLSVLRPQPRPHQDGPEAPSPELPSMPGETPPAGMPPEPVSQDLSAPEEPAKLSEQTMSLDPRAAAIVEMAKSPLADPGQAALVKPVESWTESEMKDALNHAQTGFRGWRTGDPQKALAYERVQDWHTLMYGDGEQQFDGGKPVESKALVAIPKQTAPPRTIDGQDLYQASGRIGQKVAEAAGTDGLADAVKGLQRGLNMLGQQPMPARSPAWAPYTKQAPLAEDGAYGPKTDFALKQAIGRLGSAKVDDALALGRFNTFARQAQSTGNVDGLEQKTHAIFGPLFRAPNDTKAPKVEGGVFQETLNQIGGQRDDWTPLKVDNWIGPKTTAAFGHLLQNEDADSITSAFGRGLGLL